MMQMVNDETVEGAAEERDATDSPSTSATDHDNKKDASTVQTKEESTEEKMKRMDALLNRKRKKVAEQPSQSSNVSTKEKEEDDLTKRRREEARHKILWETERAKERADRIGPQGWVRPKSLNTNKEFLSRTIQSTLSRMQKREREEK